MATQSTYINLTLPAHGEFENVWEIPVNNNFTLIDNLFAPTRISGGHSHSGEDGQGPKINHSDLVSPGTNTHDQIDSHIASTALHQDTQIGTVSGDHSSSPVTSVSNVSTLKFANATVVDEGSGVILVTAQAQSVQSPPEHVKPESAPIVAVDNFTWPTGRPISVYGWKVLSSGTPSAKEFQVAGPQSSTVGDHAELQLYDLSGVAPQQGYVISQSEINIPHGTAQRVTLDVVRANPVNPLTWIQADDLSISLDLLSAHIAGDYTRPVDYGLSLRIRKPSGSLTVQYQISLKSSSTSEVLWTDFTGNLPELNNDFQNLDPEFMVGTHEFSLRRHTTKEDSFYLNYYYNGGLVFTKLFDEDDTDVTVQAFVQGLKTLQGNLVAEINPKQPTFGYMGYSVGWSLGAARDFDVWVRNFTSTSQDDLDLVRIVALASPPASPESQVQACSSGEYADVFIGDEFDFDGPTSGLPSSDWIVSSKFVAGAEGSQNSDGFYVQNQSDSSFEIVWCSSPVADTSLNYEVVSNQLSQVVDPTGLNLPTGDINEVDVEYVFSSTGTSVPFEWEYPMPTGAVYSAGDPVPSSFLTHENLQWDTDSNGKSRLNLTYSTGTRLPWNSNVDVKVTARYEPFFETTFSELLTVKPAIPSFDQVVYLLWDDEADPVRPVWRSFGTGNFVPEDSIIFVGVSGPDLPLGQNFWSNGYYSWGFDDAEGDFAAYDIMPVSTTSPLWTGLRNGAFIAPVTSPVVGYPPDFVASPGQAIPPSLRIDPTDSRTLAMAFTRLSQNQYLENLSDRGYSISINNPETGEIYTPGGVVTNSLVVPRRPRIITQETLTSPNGAARLGPNSVVTARVYGKHFDPSPTVILGDGWASPSKVISPNDPNLTYTDNGDRTQTILVENQRLGATISTNPQLTIRNTEAFQSFPSTSAVTATFGALGGTVSPSALSGFVGEELSLAEDHTRIISIKVNSLDGGAFVTFTEPGEAQNPYFRLNAITKGTVVDPGDGFFTWTLNVTTTETSANEGNMPTSAPIYVVNGNGKYTSTNVPVELSTQPTLDGVGIDSPYNGSNDIWYIGNGEPTTRDIYFETTNLSAAARMKALNPVAGGLVIEEPLVELIAGQRYRARARLLSGTQSFSTMGFTTNKPIRPGATALEDTLNPAIEFRTLLGASQDPIWDVAPAEGHYAQFTLAGSFNPSDGVGSNITLEFLDADDLTDLVHSSGPVVITAATSSSISGSVRFDDNTAGSEIQVKITHTDVSPNDVKSLNTGTVVSIPPVPTVSSTTLQPAVEGSTGATLTLTGTALVPPTAPSGRTALNYVYSFTSSGSPAALVNTSPQTQTATSLVYQTDITAATGGQAINLALNYLGGNTANFNNLVYITESTDTDTDPLITQVQLWNAGTSDFSGSPPSGVIVRPNGTAILRLTGTGLNSSNVDPADFHMEVVGEEFFVAESPVDDPRETAPGAGITGALGSPNRFEIIDMVQQSDTEIRARVPATMDLSNLRCRVRLARPSGHPDGSGNWDIATVDSTGLGTKRGIQAFGTTYRYGNTSIAPRMNVDPGQGITQLDVARSFQTQLAAGNEDGTLSITLRLQAAQATAPTVVGISDDETDAALSNIQVSATANPLEYTVTADLPDPGTGNTLDSPYDETQSAYVSLRFSSGHIIAGGRLGATDWGSQPGQLSF